MTTTSTGVRDRTTTGGVGTDASRPDGVPLSLGCVFRSREQFVRNGIGLLLEPGLKGVKALVEVPPQRSGVPHRCDKYTGDEREHGQAEAQRDEPRHVVLDT